MAKDGMMEMGKACSMTSGFGQCVLIGQSPGESGTTKVSGIKVLAYLVSRREELWRLERSRPLSATTMICTMQ